MFTGSIRNGVLGIFRWDNPSGRTMVLGWTQPLTEMSVRNISWVVKVASAEGWQPYQFHVPIVMQYGGPKLLEHSGSVEVCNRDCVTFTLYETPGSVFLHSSSPSSSLWPSSSSSSPSFQHLEIRITPTNRLRVGLVLYYVAYICLL